MKAERIVMCAAAATAWLLYVTGAAGVGTSDRDYVFSPRDPAWTQAMTAAVDVPIGAPASASNLAARGSLAIAKGRNSATRDLAAVATAAAVAAFGAWLRAIGVAMFPAGLTMLAMAVSAMFWSRGVAWHHAALSPALGLIAAWSLWRWLQTGRRLFAGLGGVLAAMAISDDAAWLAVLPAAGVVIWQSGGPATFAQGASADKKIPALRTGLILIVIAVFGAWPFVMRAGIAADMPWAQLTGDTPPGAVSLWAHAVMSQGGPGLFSVITDLSSALTPLGACLLLIGLVVSLGAAGPRMPVAIAAVSFVAWYVLAPRSRFEPISVPMAVCGWATVAVALGWLQRSAPARAARVLVAIVGVMLIAEPMLTRVRLSALGKDTASDLRARAAAEWRRGGLASGSALVAESLRSDSAVLLASRQAGQPALIVPQATDVIASVIKQQEVFALAGARANLERAGFLFERVWASDAPLSVIAAHVPCVDLRRGEWPDVSRHAGGRSFSVHGATPETPPSGVVLRVASAEPLRVSAIEPRSIEVEVSDTPRDAAGVAELERAARYGGVPALTSIRIPETSRPGPITVVLNRDPIAVVATSEGPGPARLCAGAHRGPLTIGRAATASAALRMNDGAPFGAGWHTLEADPDYFRWTAAPNAAVRITMAQPGPVRVTITATPAARPAQAPALGLTVNGCQLATRPMQAGQGDYEWEVGAECWQPGYNQIWIGTSALVTPASLVGGHDTRLLGARIGAIRFARR